MKKKRFIFKQQEQHSWRLDLNIWYKMLCGFR